MGKNTRKHFEQHLNELYSESFTRSQFIKKFVYLTVKGRPGGSCPPNRLTNAYLKKQGGALLRKYDTLAFYTQYHEWTRLK